MPELTIDHRRLLIQVALDRCEGREREKRDIHADPRSCSLDRQLANARLDMAEREFGWQWRNVREVLAALDTERKTPAAGRRGPSERRNP